MRVLLVSQTSWLARFVQGVLCCRYNHVAIYDPIDMIVYEFDRQGLRAFTVTEYKKMYECLETNWISSLDRESVLINIMKYSSKKYSDLATLAVFMPFMKSKAENCVTFVVECLGFQPIEKRRKMLPPEFIP